MTVSKAAKSTAIAKLQSNAAAAPLCWHVTTLRAGNGIIGLTSDRREDKVSDIMAIATCSLHWHMHLHQRKFLCVVHHLVCSPLQVNFAVSQCLH